MSKSNKGIPAGRENMIAHLVCERGAEAIDFYKKAFGAVEVIRLTAPDGKRIMHSELRFGTGLVFLADDFPEYCGGHASSPKALKGTPVTLHQYVEDCDAAIKRAADAGATVVMPPADMFWGDRYGVVSDPFGHKWSFGTQVKKMSATEMEAAMADAFALAATR